MIMYALRHDSIMNNMHFQTGEVAQLFESLCIKVIFRNQNHPLDSLAGLDRPAVRLFPSLLTPGFADARFC